MRYLHNAVLRELNGKYYIIVQPWNPGGFAILEQVTCYRVVMSLKSRLA